MTGDAIRCNDRTGGGRYRCERETGHDGAHWTTYPSVIWRDESESCVVCGGYHASSDCPEFFYDSTVDAPSSESPT